MSKAKDKYYKFKAESDTHFGGLQSDITDYINKLERLTICTGCGHLSWDEIKPPAKGCCPDASYIPVRDFVRKMWYENIALATDKRMLEQENKTLKLEQGQCLLCAAKHKEEMLKLKQQKAELIKLVKKINLDIHGDGIEAITLDRIDDVLLGFEGEI